MKKKTLRAGDTLTIPKGWTVEIDDSRVSIYGPGYMAESPRGYSWGDFILECDIESRPKATISRQLIIGMYRCGWDDSINGRPYNPTGQKDFDSIDALLKNAGKQNE